MKIKENMKASDSCKIQVKTLSTRPGGIRQRRMNPPVADKSLHKIGIR
jgi:hypothetical protein